MMKHYNARQNFPIAAVFLCTNVKNKTELLWHFITKEDSAAKYYFTRPAVRFPPDDHLTL